MLQIDFRKQGDIYYPSTEVHIDSAKPNRLCLSVKSVLSPTTLLPLDIFKCGKNTQKWFSMLMWKTEPKPTLKTNHVTFKCY